MRINKFIAVHANISRRKADSLVSSGAVTVNGKHATAGQDVSASDAIYIDGKRIDSRTDFNRSVILVNKPVGYVCSRDGQGSHTIYELLPKEYHNHLIAGRLDKDSSGLVVLTNDGNLVQTLTHPSSGKTKTYTVTINKPLTTSDADKLLSGVDIGDEHQSRFASIETLPKKNTYQIELFEGRNRQIRRTLSALGYTTSALTRIRLANYSLAAIGNKRYIVV